MRSEERFLACIVGGDVRRTSAGVDAFAWFLTRAAGVAGESGLPVWRGGDSCRRTARLHLICGRTGLMLTSDARLLTTHTGSLPRPAALTELYARRAGGEAVD